MNPIDVLFENDFCMVLNKPAGLPVQGGAGVKVSLDSILRETRPSRPLLVHRLDKDTSGVILVAKNPEAAARFSALLAERRAFTGDRTGVCKQYLAVCAGRPRPDSGLITLNLVIGGAEKTAQTAYKRLSGGKDFSLLELELGTGRTHQIRRHLAAVGNPVLGDDKYGDFALNKKLRRERGLKRLLLHASRLVVPGTGSIPALDISAPPPDYFASFLERSGR
jgi:23S rRNA pseudouridine955/2504/2580 synthase